VVTIVALGGEDGGRFVGGLFHLARSALDQAVLRRLGASSSVR
jgi:hypothetical protein